MAEVLLGTVASAAGLASLAVQLVESGKKLKAFYDDVKDAPEDLKRVQEHLSTLAMLLNAVRSNEMMISVLTNSAQFEHCMRSCEVAAKEVLLLVKKLEAGMKKSKRWGAIKSVLKKDDLKKLDERLEKAIGLLHLSCSLHGMWVTSRSTRPRPFAENTFPASSFKPSSRQFRVYRYSFKGLSMQPSRGRSIRHLAYATQALYQCPARAYPTNKTRVTLRRFPGHSSTATVAPQ